MFVLNQELGDQLEQTLPLIQLPGLSTPMTLGLGTVRTYVNRPACGGDNPGGNLGTLSFNGNISATSNRVVGDDKHISVSENNVIRPPSYVVTFFRRIA